METSVYVTPLWPVVAYFVLTILLVTAMIAVSYFLGERHRERATAEPYESGITSTGTAQVRFDVRFYLVAMFFVIFDLEAIFVFAWSVAIRELGWDGYYAVLIFIAVLIIVLIYLWRLGALDWAPASPSIRNGKREG
jgi:NADH-quinone oxidoreductase subunit A